MMYLCTMTVAANADDAAVLPEDVRDDHVISAEHSLFPERWCIHKFIAQSNPESDGAYDATSVPMADAPLLGDAPEYTDRSSLYSRVMELPKLPLMTLWRGRDSALVLGVGRSGLLGVSLDDDSAE